MNIAILLPCYNEEKTIANVIQDFHKVLPTANIYVYDNNSTDKTSEIANQFEYCNVVPSPIQGKGAVVKHMFQDIDSDIYIIADGDMTYPAKYAPQLIEEIQKGADMVIGDRLSSNFDTVNKRIFHGFGNRLVKNIIKLLYHESITDIMTGYRAFNKNFVKSISIESIGFEIETEMTIFAIETHKKIVSIPIMYQNRPEGSYSKLHTYKDGFKVVKYAILHKLKHRKD